MSFNNNNNNNNSHNNENCKQPYEEYLSIIKNKENKLLGEHWYKLHQYCLIS